MPTFIIHIKAGADETTEDKALEKAMTNENFRLLNDATCLQQKVFAYYGNQELQDVSNSVQRAGRSIGRQFCFTICKDKFAENQYHHIL